MFLPLNKGDVDQLAKLLIDIKPDEVQLNTSTRSYPKSWHIAARRVPTRFVRKFTLRKVKDAESSLGLRHIHNGVFGTTLEKGE